MAGKTVQRRRGTTADHATFTGAVGEISIDLTKKVAVVHDGVTAGGFPMALSGDLTTTVYTTGGTSTAYTLTPSPAIAAYATGQSFFVNFNAASGAAPTLAISGVATPPNLVKQNPDGTFTNIAANDIPSGHRSRVTLISSTQVMVERLPSAVLSGTAQATTSGTSKDFTSIPAGTKRITVMLADVSTNGISLQQVQIGDSGGVEVTGYNSAATTNGVSVTSTTGFLVNYRADAANQTKGALVLTLLDAATNTWVAHGCTTGAGGASGDVSSLAGSKALSGTLDRVRLTTVNGTDVFDAGSVNILYE